MNFRDVELLSAYLDRRLGPSDAARLEARLSSDANLKATLEDLRETRGLLRRLPQRRAPRNFRLTPSMAGIRPPEPRAYPVFRLATALAAFLFVASVAVNAFTPFAASRLAAAHAPAYGIGGGSGGGGAPEGESATAAAMMTAQAPPQAPFAAIAPTAAPEGTLSAAATAVPPQAQDTTRALGGGPTEQASKAAPLQSAVPAPANQQPVPLTWVILLGVLMLVCAVAAWLLRRNNEQRIRNEWNHK
jgi:hypothetical protein